MQQYCQSSDLLTAGKILTDVNFPKFQKLSHANFFFFFLPKSYDVMPPPYEGTRITVGEPQIAKYFATPKAAPPNV